MNHRDDMDSNRWQLFVAFWLLAGVALLTIGIATFAGAHHGHRVGAVIALMGIACLAIGLVVRRAGRRHDSPPR